MPAEIQLAAGWSARSGAASCCRRANDGKGSAPSGATAITPPQAEAVLPRDGVGQLARLRRARPRRAPRPAGRSRLTCTSACSRRSAAWAPRSRAATSGPVDRVHRVSVTGDGAGLVALQLADEVHAQGAATVRAPGSASLADGLLVAVLGQVGHAELGEPHEVGRREELGDDDQPDACRVASGVGAGRGDAVLDLGKARRPARTDGRRRRRRSRLAPLGQQPDDAGEASGAAGRDGRSTGPGLPGAARAPSATRHVVRPELVPTPAATSMDGVPVQDTVADTGSTVAASARISGGTS